jgi:hypothetical protein
MLKVVNLIREIHVDTIIIVDDYDNYYVYGSDCYIVYYLIDLSIKRYRNSLFIKNKIEYINYLIDKLNKNNVNYIVVVKRFGYNVDASNSFIDNNYSKYLNKGKIKYKRIKDIKYISSKLRLDIINNRDKIKRIKEIIGECM